MSKLKYYNAKIKEKLTKNHEHVSNYYRKQGVKVGDNCIICGYPYISDPALVEIKNNVVVSSNVSIITHDHSIYKVVNNGSNLFGKVVIGNNCFIGFGSILLYGVELADNVIVASGSVVTKSFHSSNIIIGGNPAKIIGTWDKFKNKYSLYAANRNEMNDIISGKINKLVTR